MTLTRRDLGATLVTALAVGVYLANHYAWNVWLVGDSNRWAIAAVGVLGIVGCSLGRPTENTTSTMSMVLGALGMASLVVAVIGLVSGSQAMLGLLTLLVVVLWFASTLRHAVHIGHRHVTA